MAEVVLEWKSGRGPRPSIFRPCSSRSCDGGVVQDLPEDVTHAVLEARLASGHVGDVVLFRGSDPAVVIEIRATSPVGAEKAARLELPWVELGARDVVDRPYWWVALQDGLRPFTCPACAEREAGKEEELADVRRRAEELARRAGVALTSNREYHPVPHVCWRCAAEMVVYAWPGSGKHARSRPPEPIPSSVQQRWTDGAGHYWANCCPACSAVQGDYHLGSGNTEYARVRETLRALYLSRPRKQG